MIHNTPRPTINYTDAELAILHNPRVSEDVKNALYQSKLSENVKETKEVVLTRVIKLSDKNAGEVSNVKGDLVDGSIITWVSSFSWGYVEECSGSLEVDEDGSMFIWDF